MVEGVGSPHGCPLRMGATQHAGDTDKASLDPKTPASRHSGRFPVLSPLAHRVVAEASPVSGDKVTLKLGQEEVKLFRGHLNAGWKVRSPCFQEGEEAEPRKRGVSWQPVSRPVSCTRASRGLPARPPREAPAEDARGTGSAAHTYSSLSSSFLLRSKSR